MADAYLELGVAIAEGDGLAALYEVGHDAGVQETQDMLVIDVFSTSHQGLHLVRGDTYIASACVRRGWIPVSPWSPTVVITVRALEVYRMAHLRCLRLGIQVFVRTLCNIHGVAPRSWLGAQFSIAFEVDKRVQVALGRDAPHWRLKNACPCCLYKVQGEQELKIPFMATFDGNNSLSRFERREKVEVDEDGTCAPGLSKERLDDRVAPGDYYLLREEVDRWGKDGVQELMKSFSMEREEEEDGCSECWQNMKGNVVDMVKSGELSKYPLSIVHHLLTMLDEVAGRYDIGCKFSKLVKAHPALNDLACDKNFRALVGAFHGHGHNRLCGLKNLMTYVEGVGLEPLEGCESFFSKSNALASTTRYASRFYRQQAITMYLKHTNAFDTYHSLTTLLCNKYQRALEIKATYAALRETMRELGVESRDEFNKWWVKEKAYLCTLSKEPEQETLEMEYLQKLVNLQDADCPSSLTQAAKATRGIETQRRHMLEVQVKALAAVQDLEVRLDVMRRWVPEDENWAEVSVMVRRRRYQRALDHLQGLIISRIFELAKCNMSDTGYKLRKHVAKPLQARSKAVKNGITRYNDVAQTMTPPKPTLNWEEVVEYAFLADFDLLHKGQEDIRGELWAQPAGRAAMDQHYKLLRADEEIQCLNVEIRRLVTYMVDEAAFLAAEEGRLRKEGEEALAVQVGLLRMERVRFTAIHMLRLTKLSKEPGFTGVSVSRERHTPVVRHARDRDVEMRTPLPLQQQEENRGDGDEEEEVESDDNDGELAEAFMNVVRIAHDDTIEAEDI
ncbi:hypothetical protein B0H19DRAFT_1224037 [Mycena capillaripes]|nr:hypothetical protein B0H19DRAFT_1224037 [Mycena capillaripes]